MTPATGEAIPYLVAAIPPRYPHPMTCAWCRQPMGYVHGHAACLNGSCAMFGVNQAECCGGETAETCPAPTSAIGRTPVGDG